MAILFPVGPGSGAAGLQVNNAGAISRCCADLGPEEAHPTVAESAAGANEGVPFVPAYEASHLPAPQVGGAGRDRGLPDQLDRPLQLQRVPEAVKRSLITVMSLTYRPMGGIAIARGRRRLLRVARPAQLKECCILT